MYPLEIERHGDNMDLNALSLFVAAAQAGSLSEAARKTGVPLPTLSRRVRKLEDDIGVRLLERGSQGLALTQAGAQLFADVGPAVALLAQAEHRIQDASGISGTLRLSIPPHFEPMWSVMEVFGRRFPEVRIDIFVTDRRVDLVADGVDAVIRVGEGGRSTYVGRTLARYRHRLVAAPSYLRGVRLKKPEDVTRLRCACWRATASPSWELGDTTVPLEPVLATNDYRHLLHLAIAGQAVTEVPPFLATGPIARGQLVELLPDHPFPLQSVRALVADTRLLSPVVRHFLDFAAEAVPAALGPVSGD
ncbi:MAG: LysR family transcriptional regulator [Polyangiaceae bacterium]